MGTSTSSTKVLKTTKAASKVTKGSTKNIQKKPSKVSKKDQSDTSDSYPDDDSEADRSEANERFFAELVQLEEQTRADNLTCDICLDTKDASLFHEGKLAPTCKHPSSLCKECITGGIDVQLSGKRWEAIECVICKVILPSNTLRQYLSTEDFQRYNDYISNFHISKAKLYTQCQHPTCGFGQIHYGGGRHPQMTCNKCGHVTCYKCKVPYHQGRTCRAYKQARVAAAIEAKLKALPEDERSELTVKTITNICPGCKAPVQRWTGCRNMMCVCGTGFYWEDPVKEFVKELEAADNATLA